VHKRPTFSTKVASHVSGREVRRALYAYPLYEFELTYDGLDGLGTFAGLQANSLQSLQALYAVCQGQFGTFIYIDPTDNYQAPGSTYGVAMAPVLGSTTQFTFQRSIGPTGPTFAPEAVTFVGGTGSIPAMAANPQVYVSGTLQTPSSAYTWTPGSNIVSFASVPSTTPTASFYFGFICRFLDDQEDFENFMQGLWKVDSLKFRSVKP
jgi:hypothetical protein